MKTWQITVLTKENIIVETNIQVETSDYAYLTDSDFKIEVKEIEEEKDKE